MAILRIPHYCNPHGEYTSYRVMRMSKPRKTPLGDKNIVGAKVEQLRKEKKIKQKDFVAMLQNRGMDICDTSMSRLEGQIRLVQDYEVVILAEVLGVTVEWLLSGNQDE